MAWFRITVHRTDSEGAVAGVDGFCAEIEVLILPDSIEVLILPDSAGNSPDIASQICPSR